MRSSAIVSVLVAALIPFGAQANDTITLQSKIPYAKDIVVPGAVRTECQLPEKTAVYVQQYAAKGMNVKVADSVSAKTPGKVLVMKITNVIGGGGGAWSGAKSVTTEGTLYNNGKAIGSFKAARQSGGGAFGGYKGTCSILGRCIKAIGKDVGVWLQSPAMDSRLGDMR